MLKKCSQVSCAKVYLSCFALTAEKIKDLTQEHQNLWNALSVYLLFREGITPKHMTLRRHVLVDTSFSPNNNDNSVRGTRGINRDIDKGDRILDEIKHFRLEAKSRLEEQSRLPTLLQNIFIHTELELQEIKQQMRVLQEKSDNLQQLESKTEVLLYRHKELKDNIKDDCSAAHKKLNTAHANRAIEDFFRHSETKPRAGILVCLDGYMNIALEQTEEYVNGELKIKYGDVLIRGNNVLYISMQKRRL